MNLILDKNAEILESSGINYDISICIIAYNKEKYIGDAIESVLMQKTDLTYEIVVGDNDSTDNTRKILRNYWNENRETFTIIFNSQNWGISINQFNTLCKAKGKYVVILYGDDYWLKNDALQKEYDFLESHKEFFGVSSRLAYIYDGEDKPFRYAPPVNCCKKEINLKMYLSGIDFPMSGLMFRNDHFSNNIEHFRKMVLASKEVDDASFCILFLMKGDVYILQDALGAYRVFRKNQASNNFNSINKAYKRSLMNINLCNNLLELTDQKLDFGIRYGFVLASAFKAMIKHEITKREFSDLVSKVYTKYRKKWIWYMSVGIFILSKRRFLSYH